VRPLDGITVLDLTRLLPGAAATMMLANFGAEVIKVEEPGGDYARYMPPLVDGEGAVFRATNRGKKSIALNLKAAEDRQTLLRLAGEADVTGAIPGAQIADLAGGSMQAVIGILLALAARQKSGRGQFVDVSMLDGVAWLMTLPLAVHSATGEIPRAGAAALSGRYACYRTYLAADGRWLAVGALEPKFWAQLCEKLGRPEFIVEQFTEGERQAAIVENLRQIFKTKSSGEWLDLLGGADVCVTLVRNVAEVAADPSLRAGEVIPKLSDTPGRAGHRPPRLGER